MRAAPVTETDQYEASDAKCRGSWASTPHAPEVCGSRNVGPLSIRNARCWPQQFRNSRPPSVTSQHYAMQKAVMYFNCPHVKSTFEVSYKNALYKSTVIKQFIFIDTHK